MKRQNIIYKSLLLLFAVTTLIGCSEDYLEEPAPTQSVSEDVIFDSVCRLGKSELNQVKEKFGFQFATEDYHELLERDLDGVIVSSPHTLHFEHSKAALLKGINVLCEKPMTTSSEQSRELVDIAEKNNLHLMMSHGWHYTPFVQKAKNLIDQGIIGDIESIVCHMASPTRELLEGKDFLRGDDASGEIMFSPESNTWADPVQAGGGYGYAQMSHSLALTFLLVNVQPKEVFAYMSSPTSKVELYDSIVAKFNKSDPFFKKVVDSQKVYAKKVMAYLLLNSPDYGMAYRHHFGEPTKAI